MGFGQKCYFFDPFRVSSLYKNVGQPLDSELTKLIFTKFNNNIVLPQVTRKGKFFEKYNPCRQTGIILILRDAKLIQSRVAPLSGVPAELFHPPSCDCGRRDPETRRQGN